MGAREVASNRSVSESRHMAVSHASGRASPEECCLRGSCLVWVGLLFGMAAGLGGVAAALLVGHSGPESPLCSNGLSWLAAAAGFMAAASVAVASAPQMAAPRDAMPSCAYRRQLHVAASHLSGASGAPKATRRSLVSKEGAATHRATDATGLQRTPRSPAAADPRAFSGTANAQELRFSRESDVLSVSSCDSTGKQRPDAEDPPGGTPRQLPSSRDGSGDRDACRSLASLCITVSSVVVICLAMLMGMLGLSTALSKCDSVVVLLLRGTLIGGVLTLTAAAFFAASTLRGAIRVLEARRSRAANAVAAMAARVKKLRAAAHEAAMDVDAAASLPGKTGSRSARLRQVRSFTSNASARDLARESSAVSKRRSLSITKVPEHEVEATSPSLLHNASSLAEIDAFKAVKAVRQQPWPTTKHDVPPLECAGPGRAPSTARGAASRRSSARLSEGGSFVNFIKTTMTAQSKVMKVQEALQRATGRLDVATGWRWRLDASLNGLGRLSMAWVATFLAVAVGTGIVTALTALAPPYQPECVAYFVALASGVQACFAFCIAALKRHSAVVRQQTPLRSTWIVPLAGS